MKNKIGDRRLLPGASPGEGGQNIDDTARRRHIPRSGGLALPLAATISIGCFGLVVEMSIVPLS
ncbi:MAG: hypothetical protein JXB35_10740 [Anaerolineae bacterium]|nr:hypothetical protein [Anaerolineae bacterium]